VKIFHLPDEVVLVKVALRRQDAQAVGRISLFRSPDKLNRFFVLDWLGRLVVQVDCVCGHVVVVVVFWGKWNPDARVVRNEI
jgi:hypothetical protein